MRTQDHPSPQKPTQVMRALLLGTALTLSVGPMFAHTAFAQSAAETVYNFSQTSQPLRSAVAAFSLVSGINVAADGAIPASVTAGAVTGPMSIANGLEQMLAGTGYRYRFSGANSVILLAPANDTAGPDELSFDGLLLDPIVIKGGNGVFHAGSNFEEAASVVYQDSQDIQRFRGVSAGDFLKGEPGVLNGENRNSGALDVNVRGMQGQGRVPVVIDGSFQESTVYRGYSGIAGRTYLDPDLIGSMSIEKGPSAAADATGAVGGTMRVSTLKPNDILEDGETLGARVTLGVTGNTTGIPAEQTVGGTNDPARFDRPSLLSFGDSGNGSVAVAGKFGNLEVLGAYARRKTGNYFAGANGSGPDDNGLNRFNHGEEVLNTSQDNTSLLLRGVYSWGNNHSVELSYMNYQSDFGEMMPSQILRANSIWQNPLSHVDVDTVTARYRWNPEDNDLIDLKADLFYTQNTSNVNQIFIQHSGPPFNITGVEHIIYLNKVTQWGANVHNTSEFDIAGRPLTLSYGASYKHEVIGQPDNPNSYLPDIEPPTFPPVPGSTLVNARVDSEFRDGWRKEASAFVAAEYQPTDQLTLNAALRYTHLETQDNNPISGTEPDNRTVSGTAPVFSALYEIQPGLQVYGKYAEALRMPSLFESTNGWSAVPSLSAAPLRPEHAKTKEIGVNYQTEDLFGTGGLLRTKLTYFDNDIKDYITRETSGAYNFVNIQRARLRGWELALDYEQGNFFGKFTYSKYVETEYCDVDGTCSSGGTQGGYAHLHVPPEQSASLTLGGRFMEEKLEMGARVNYIGERASVDFSGVSGGTNRAVNWDPYTTVDLFGSYKFNDQVTLDWAVDNLTDQYYMDSLTIGLLPSPGRTVRVGLTANF